MVQRVDRKQRVRSAAALALAGLVAAAPPPAEGAGHGPGFALATPTNSRDGWSLDVGLMGRTGPGERGVMFRSMVSYGLTADLMLSVSAPARLEGAALPPARVTGMMSANRDFEALAAWRFHRQGLGVGRRFESTAYAGLTYPASSGVPSPTGSLRRSPGGWAAVATGYASLSHYFWVGGGFQRFAARDGNRRPDLVFYSATWAYRPPALRKDYPHWDGRFFLEVTGEDFGRTRRGGAAVPGTGGHQIFAGPTTLWLYRNHALQGGVLFPVYRDLGDQVPRERARFVLNYAHFFE